MPGKELLLKIILSRYEFEHEKMEKINARIPHLTTLFIAVCGIGAYIIQKVQSIESCELGAITWIISLIAFMTFCIATYNAFIVFKGYTYSYLPSADDTVTHMQEYEAVISGDEFDEVRDEYYQTELQSVMIDFAKDCADENSEINGMRSLALSKSITYYSVAGVIAIFLVGFITAFSHTPLSQKITQNNDSCFCSKKSVYYTDTIHLPFKIDPQCEKNNQQGRAK